MMRVDGKRRVYYTCGRAHHSFGKERCQYLPRTHRALPLEEAVWEEVHSVLTSPDYLIGLAHEYLTSQTSQQITTADERREIQVRLDQLEKQETRIVRDLADQDKLDLVDRTIEAITN